jgi:hypothetical protein
MDLSKIKKLITKIEFDDKEAELSQMYDLVDLFRELQDERDIVSYLFEWFEMHWDKDLGSPGPFVHFIEEKDDYREALVTSVCRKPTTHSLWMVNRIMNGMQSGIGKDTWINLLKSVVNNKVSDDCTVKAAEDYIDYQNSK